MRTMVEAMHYLMLCYQMEAKWGQYHKDWLDAVIRFCDTMVEIQNENGSWNRAYDMNKTCWANMAFKPSAGQGAMQSPDAAT